MLILFIISLCVKIKLTSMLELKNIQFQGSSKLFSKQTRKLIRFSYKNSIITSKRICTVVNEATIKWEQALRIPEVYGQSIDFEIYNEHEFGYNPEELQNLLYGTIKLTENKTIGKFQVSIDSDENKKAGFLLFDIKKLIRKFIPATTTESDVVKTLTSILIRNLREPQQNGYITVNNGKFNFKSQLVEAIKGQFYFNMLMKSQQYLIKSTNSKERIIISFHGENNQIIGVAQYNFRTDKKVFKADLEHELDDSKVGEIYFEIQIEDKGQERKKLAQEIVAQQQKQVVEEQPQPKLQRQTKPPKSTMSQYRSMSLSRLTQMGSSQFLGTARHKKMSVIHSNGDVVFPSEKRFMIYQDKQTNVISYSKLPSMKFEEEHSKKYYKGASIGVGNKADFTLYYRQNPGVGQYKLPSIFDRY